MNKKFIKPALISVFALVLIGGAVSFGLSRAKAEISDGTPESGVVSRIKTLYTALTSASYGADADGAWGAWGAYWNRIYSAATWTPTVTSTATDVKTGKTFVPSGSRTNSTGTYPAPGPCSTQAWNDDHGAPVTEGTNCSQTWTASSSPVTGDDARAGRGGKDPVTGLVWSQLLLNSAGTVAFSPTTNSAWSWDASAAANVAVGGKTASLICSERGNGWRLPTQKELMQAYIDGSFWNLSQPSYVFWSATEASATTAWYVSLLNGYTNSSTKTSGYQVRCVR